ncbi:MAG: hypothetical protein WCP19_00460 [Chloroflexota bacterium]
MPGSEMRARDYLSLFIAGMIFNIILAWFQLAPGYMDSDYYYAGGLRLVQGHGFTETYLWNYLDNPQNLPHPSHAYWYPLASILSAAGMFLFGKNTFWAARSGFILAASLVSPITAYLGYKISGKRGAGITAGLLAIFCGYHAPFLPTTDNFGIYLLLGGIFFLLILEKGKKARLGLGLVIGLMNLARVDGIIWLALAILSVVYLGLSQKPKVNYSSLMLSILTILLGYSLVMAPWFIRNMLTWGTPLTPSGSNVIWMTKYEDTFAWPAARINMANWLNTGIRAAMDARLYAMKLNGINTIAAQFAFILFPFSLIGIWVLRKDFRVLLAVLGWIILFFVMSIIFPFAGSRGSFFHSAAALQPLWIVCAVMGVDALHSSIRIRKRFIGSTPGLFRTALVFAMMLLTFFLSYTAIVDRKWNQFKDNYDLAENILIQHGAGPGDVVLTANSPGYFAETGRSAVIVPDENLEGVLLLAKKFNARYLILEKTYVSDALKFIFENPQGKSGLTLIGESENVRVFQIKP